jgi:hypothetical protein
VRISHRGISYGLAGLVVLVGAGLIVYRMAGERPVPPGDCQETILDPDPDRSRDASGSLHLSTCPEERRVIYHLSLVDYLRQPPVIGAVLDGSIELRRHPGRAPIRAHWVETDLLEVDYPAGLRISWQSASVGPVRVHFVAGQDME